MNNGMTGFQLKVIGVVTMVIDHIGEFFLFLGVPMWFHWIGRIAAPIFLFESSEGFIHTSNRKKYMFRLLAGYWLMGIINTILNHYFTVGDTIVVNNIFGTIFLGTVYMQACEYFKKRETFFKGLIWFLVPTLLSVFAMILLSSGSLFDSKFGMLFFQGFTLLVPTVMMAEGGILLIALAVLFYLFHGKKVLQVVVLIIVALITLIFGGGIQHAFTFNYQWMMFLAAIPIILYNGEKGRSMRNFFYIFYPAHIAIFALISFFLQR